MGSVVVHSQFGMASVFEMVHSLGVKSWSGGFCTTLSSMVNCVLRSMATMCGSNWLVLCRTAQSLQDLLVQLLQQRMFLQAPESVEQVDRDVGNEVVRTLRAALRGRGHRVGECARVERTVSG